MLPSRLFFDNFLDDFEPKKIDMMKCDIYEEKDKYIVEADAPGMKKENINITIDDGNLTIEAVKEENDNIDKKYLHRERYFREKYTRSFYLGEICEDEIKAEFKDGILKISVPKKIKEDKNKKVISID